MASANNWVGSDRDPSGIATYRGITSAGCLLSFPPPKAAIHEIIGFWYDADLPVGRSPVTNLSTPVDSLQCPLVYCSVPS
jgi:hypothetical protein